VAVGLDVKGFGNAVSGLRWALRHHDLLDPAAKALSADATAWHQLLKAVAATGGKYHFGLAGFAAWCHGRGVAPTSACDETLLAFQHHLETKTLRADIPGLICTVAKCWRKAANMIATWPGTALRAPASRLEFTGQIARITSSMNQINHLAAKLRRIRRSRFGHHQHLW
jgi:hypothetical protein